MRFALLAVAAILWSLTTLRWSISRRKSPWRLRLIVVSTVALVLAAISAVADLQLIRAAARAPSSGVTIAIIDEGQWWQVAYRRGLASFVNADAGPGPAGI